MDSSIQIRYRPLEVRGADRNVLTSSKKYEASMPIRANPSYIEAPDNVGSMESVLELIDRSEHHAAVIMCIDLGNKNDEEALQYIHTLIINQNHVDLIRDCCQQRIEKDNSPAANYFLGLMYFNGYGMEKNQARAFYYHKTAWNGGLAAAAFHIAKQYYYGQGVEQCSFSAKNYFMHADEHGSVIATHFLGLMHQKGYGAIYGPDYIKAREYFLEAFQRGLGDSAFHLAESYRTGYYLGGRPDHVNAEKWYIIAADQHEYIQLKAKNALKKYYPQAPLPETSLK